MRCNFADGECVNCHCKRSPPYPNRKCSPGLGDRVSLALSTVGITKARAQAVAEAVGATDCGCSQRQQALNEWGYAVGIGSPPPPAAPASAALP